MQPVCAQALVNRLLEGLPPKEALQVGEQLHQRRQWNLVEDRHQALDVRVADLDLDAERRRQVFEKALQVTTGRLSELKLRHRSLHRCLGKRKDQAEPHYTCAMEVAGFVV